MKNRKAKILLTCRNARGVQQWLKLSNRRMGLFTNTTDIVMCSLNKPSAAQNRWRNHGSQQIKWEGYDYIKRGECPLDHH